MRTFGNFFDIKIHLTNKQTFCQMDLFLRVTVVSDNESKQNWQKICTPLTVITFRICAGYSSLIIIMFNRLGIFARISSQLLIVSLTIDRNNLSVG